jgi:branched-chain amino acid transport system ATP-binding protein
MLQVERIDTFYGPSQVLFGLSLEIGAGEIVTLMGRNGMGKTTAVKSIMGILRPAAGRVMFEATDLVGAPPYAAGRAGLGLVPEGRQVFPTLTVEENLVATAIRRGETPWTVERIWALFPRLADRRGNLGSQLSGGEQQMLAIGRALMTNPRLLILDEATEGLAPLIRAEIWRCLAELKREGLSILLIDKNVEALIGLATRHVIIEKGRVVWSGDGPGLAADPSLRERYLGV